MASSSSGSGNGNGGSGSFLGNNASASAGAAAASSSTLSSSSSSTTSPTSIGASALAIPAPTHLSSATVTSGGLSPISRHPRNAFDSTPSFSSPLAYATTLHEEQADELDLDSSDVVTSAITPAARTLKPIYASSPPLSFRSFSTTKQQQPPRSPQLEPYSSHDSSHDEDPQRSLLDTPTPSGSASARRERSSSARARLVAWEKQDASTNMMQRTAATGSSTPSSSSTPRTDTTTSHIRRKSNVPTTLMGPPLTIPRKTSASSNSSRQESEGNFRPGTSPRLPSGMSDDSQRSISTSSTSSAEGKSSSIPWQPGPLRIDSSAGSSNTLAIPNQDKATPLNPRNRSNKQTSLSNAHRRAKSLGGSLFGESASPIGGPDGVDPDLVAAIRASDPSIPGHSSGLEASLSRMSLSSNDQQFRNRSVSPSSRIASLPSTPYASVRSSTRKPTDQLEAISDGTLQVPNQGHSPTIPRSRVRSQTLLSTSQDSSGFSSNSQNTLSSSFGPSSTMSQYANRSSAPLGEAIRLQKMPNSVRMAGLHPSPTLSPSDIASSSSPGHGLGIGMSPGSDSRLSAPPQTPNVTRSTSPMTLNDFTRSSTSSSGRNSPVVQRGRDSPGSLPETSPLTVFIPSFQAHDASFGPASAMPALHYRKDIPTSSTSSSSSSAKPMASMGPPPSAFSPLLAMPKSHLQPGKSTQRTPLPETPDLSSYSDASQRPAPWIASSQEVPRGNNPATLKAALTQRGRASMSTNLGSGHFFANTPQTSRLDSSKGKENRRISINPGPSGIDDYARIIVQSRNAKMQKWRAASKQQPPFSGNELRRRLTLGGEGSQRETSSSSRTLLQPWNQSGTGMLRASSGDHLPSQSATPNVSPAASDSIHEAHNTQQLDLAAGSREIEWVDWLDEYRKMKEAKLQSEREELETRKLEEEEAEVSVELEAVSASPFLSPMAAAVSRDYSTFPSLSRSFEPPQTLSSSMGIADARRGERPRRPSEMPRFSSARQDNFAAVGRSSSNAIFPTSGSYLDESSSTVDRRSSPFAEKSRTLSLSPITSRITGQGSQQSNYNGAPYSGKRKKMLGGKIEAWWGAVKSGFTGTSSTTTPMSFGSSTFQSPGKIDTSSRSKESPQESGLSELHSMFTSQKYGVPHNRSNTLHVNTTRRPSEAKSIHMLRAASSVQNLRADKQEVTEETSSSDAPGSSDFTPCFTQGDKTLTMQGESAEVFPPKPSPPRQIRKGTHLSLTLDKGLSAFDASPFEKLAARPTPPPQEDSAKSSPLRESRTSDMSVFKAKSESRTLSDAWKPDVASEEKSRSGSGSSSFHRGRSSQRRSGGEVDESTTSKDMTMNSVRQHIHNRLTTSKETCDRELKKVILSIHAFVEDTIQSKQLDEEFESMVSQSAGEREDKQDGVFDDDTDLESPTDGLHLQELDPLSERVSTVSASSQAQQIGGLDPNETSINDSEDGMEAPTPRRISTFKRESIGRQYKLSTPPARLSPSASISRVSSITRPATLKRNISGDGSRSTSRSHSPMPGTLSQESPQYSPARRYRNLQVEEEPLDPYLAALQDLVSIAMEVFDASINQLTSKSGACSEIIVQVQLVGKLWDENPSWLGRGWYVQLLLAVASLSRVVEWWEAERGFWNFQDDHDQGDKYDAEPIRFIFGNGTNSTLDSSDYNETQPWSARSAISVSPSRIRNPALSHISQTPSQQSSAASSPALEPWREGDGNKAAAAAPMKPLASDAVSPTEATLPISTPQGTKVDESQNVLMELSLDGERFLYVSPAWRKVIGSDPAEIFDTPIQEVLAPGDASTFAQATEHLRANDAHTVEAAFRLQVHHDNGTQQQDGMTFYQEMEGKGMLMHDRQSAMPSHTMWVFKPNGEPEAEDDLAPGQQKPAAGAGEPPVMTSEGTAAASDRILISTEPLLCRICERDVPTWFFEKHSEICNETHRLDMEISEYNEGLAELRRIARSLINAINDTERKEAVQYRTVALSTPAASLEPPSALEVANRSILPRHPNPAAIRKLHLRILDGIMDILQTAGTISTPAVKDDSTSDPIEKQRLLSPESEGKIVEVKSWRPAICDDAALDLLANDVEKAMKSKLSAVNRMLNTIVYVETVRMEWEGRVEAALAEIRDETESESSLEEDTTMQEVDVGDKSQQQVRGNESRQPLVSPREEEDEDENSAAAVLLETYDGDVAQSNSTNLSAQMYTPGSREEDIPGVESHMGGSIMDTSPIPIPSSASPNRAIRQRRMMRDPSSTSSLGVESVISPTGALHLDTFAPHSRRESLLSSEKSINRTPPLSPRNSPAELSSFRPKDRRISVTQRSSLNSPHLGSMTPLSPRIPPSAPSSRPTASSINDFDIIKPISKGAFGSVFLAKKRTTGDYYAIKVLKKSDMIAKNQITNVKAERMILMTQTQSPFVVKLFFTFQSADYLYLVMEYLPGGDCASLCKALGGLPEEWTKQYVAEVVNGLESLHSKGVVHRDMKPDNLLIDQKGHLKLTDFGLSKIGLLGRQNRQQLGTSTKSVAGTPTIEGHHAKKDSIGSVSSIAASSNPSLSPVHTKTSTPVTTATKMPETPISTGIAQSQSFYVGMPSTVRGPIMSASTDASDSSGAESPRVLTAAAKPISVVKSVAQTDSPSHIFGSQILAESLSSSAAVQSSSGSGAQLKKFVGTPDYLAPESILGLGMDDAAVDWWALGVILYEFLYGYPPFHADTPEKVFDNILSNHIDWEEDEETQVSEHARDLMKKLMCTDRKDRLGAGDNGAADIKSHAFFEGIDWDNLTKADGPFMPKITNAESTDYFDLRGAVYQEFSQEQQKEITKHSHGFNREFAKALEGKKSLEPSRLPSKYRIRLDRKKTPEGSQGAADDFGSFSYKNLPVLKQANDEVIKKMRGDQLNSMSSAMIDQTSHHHHHNHHHHRHRSISGKVGTPGHRNSMILLTGGGPPSPSTSVSSQSSVPSKSTAPTSPSGAPHLTSASHHLPSVHHHLSNQPPQHRRRPSELSSNASGAVSGSPGGMSNAGGATLLMERKRSQLYESETGSRRSSLPSRMRTNSLSGSSEKPAMAWNSPLQAQPFSAIPNDDDKTKEDAQQSCGLPASATTAAASTSTAALLLPSTDPINCLIAEDNPISLKMLENILVKLGCVVSSVRNGAEAIRLAMAESKFAVLFIDVTLPIVNGHDVARMIKSTRNINSITPIIALANFDTVPLNINGSVFDAVLAKPVEKQDVCNILPRFGFKPLLVSTRAGSGGSSSTGGGTARRATVAGLERVEASNESSSQVQQS